MEGVSRQESGTTGWAAFAATVLFIVGTLNVIYGLAGIINDEVVRNTGQGVLILDFTAWGFALLILGSIQVVTGYGLFVGATWARGFGVVFASLSAIAQMGVFGAFPLLSMTIVLLDVLVIYYLTAGWDPKPTL